jgi:hypothetical protein
VAKKRRPQTSVKQILVRDFNWRMGNLRRWYGSRYTFDIDLRDEIDRIVGEQMDREKALHEARLAAWTTWEANKTIPSDQMRGDHILDHAIREAERNKVELARQEFPS